jgi:hypothetical protein
MTGLHPISLGQAIQQLRPGVKSADEVKRAEAEVTIDLKVVVRKDGGV